MAELSPPPPEGQDASLSQSGSHDASRHKATQRELLRKRLRERQEFATCAVGSSTQRGQWNRNAQQIAASQPYRDPATDPIHTPLYHFQVHEVFDHDVPHMKPPTAPNSVFTPHSPEPPARRVRPLQPRVQQTGAAAGLSGQMLASLPPPPGTDPAAATSGRLVPTDPDEALVSSIQIAASRRPQQEKVEAVAPNDEEDIGQLRTAEDAIAFFSKAGNNSPVKFVYLTAAAKGLKFRPYDLEVMRTQKSPESSGQRCPEYFCISATGCVHVKPGNSSEVVTLAEWMRECTLFNVLTRIHFFKHYLVGKAFTQWRRNVRFRLYCQTRRRLGKQFFISKGTFAQTLVKLHKDAFELSQVKLISIPDIKEIFPHDKFKEMQQTECRNPAEQLFRRCMDNMEGKLLKLTEEVTQRANVPDLTTMESLEQYLLANATVADKDKGKSGKKMKSMVDAQAEQEERMRMLKRAMEEHKMLDKFIRLTDYIAAENLFKNVIATVGHFFDTLNKPDSDKLVMFKITITFQGEEDLVFVPSEREILDTYQSVMDEMIHLIGQVTRLIYIRDVKVHFTMPPKTFSVQTSVRQDTRYNTMKRRTCQLISKDFAAAYEQAKHYESYRKWFIFVDQEWPTVEARWEQCPDELTPEEFEKYVHDPKRTIGREHKEAAQARPVGKVIQALGDLDQLFNKPQGVLQIDSNRLRTTLQENLDEILKKVRGKLLQIARKRTKELVGDIQNKMKQLLLRPGQLQAFAQFVQSLNEIKEDSNVIVARCEDIQRLYDIAENNGIKPPLEDQGTKDMLIGGPNSSSVPLKDQFQEYITQALDYKINSLKQMSANLENYIDIANEELLATMAILNHGDYVSAHAETRDVLAQLAGVDDTIKTIEQKVKMYTDFQRLFEATPAEWTNLTAIKETYQKRFDLWSTYDKFMEKRHAWESEEIRDIDEGQLKDEIEDFYRKAHKLNKEVGDEVSELLLESVSEERKNLPVMCDLCSKDMQMEHWEEIFRGMGKNFGHDKDHFTLSGLRAWKVFDFAPLVADVSGKAKGQAAVKKTIQEIRAVWDEIEFTTKPHRDSKEIHILGDVTEILERLEEHQLTVQTQLGSRYASGDEASAKAIRRLVEEWDRNLSTVSDVLDEWVTFQKSWMYLEFIFSSDDIKKSLHEESRKFDIADKDYKELMTRARMKKNVVQVCCESGVLQTIRDDNKILDEVQKRLEEYLETKRAAFPRFYFLSNDELLEILSDVRNPRKVQPHLNKCFDNMKELMFNTEDASEVGGMRSSEGEEVEFREIVEAKGMVEVWLGKLEHMMKETLLMHMTKTYEGYQKWKREEWYFQFPAQCVLCVDMVQWTFETEEAIRKTEAEEQALAEYLDVYNDQILRTVDLVKANLTRLQRQVVNTIIVMDVHSRDMIATLIQEGVSKVSDFSWAVQLRYYWRDDNVSIEHASATLSYGYEYLGNQPRLVITPLTDRAFLTCTSALHMNLGAAPQGPAGTGKTESVKDLGKGLARQVVVFNCSDGINVATMSRFFAGLAQAGAWACFDEFNRIELEVLSVVAMQMLTITASLAQSVPEIDFDGRHIKLSKDFGVFITMNPGYAGRTELPDNLKTLFRPICMMIPDYRLIAKIMFYSEGFSAADILAQKMVQLYKLSSEQLSKQYHYDFGMRAVKSILVMAGQLKRGSPNDEEDMLLIRAMRDSNIPKFLRDDTVLFQALIRDLFPSVEIQEVSQELLEQFIRESLKTNGHQVVDSFVTKVVQVYDTMVVRHGMMTVGDTDTGKTTILETLKEALTNLKKAGHDPDGNLPLFNTVKTHWCNPKSITSTELYGEVNPVTREWSDGVLSHMSKAVAREGADGDKTRNWLVFDGPVDAVWIENLNTVLDDNRMLCLNSGERIKIPTTVIFVFEVQDLAVASPATVSRCGMVYMEPFYLEVHGWPPITRSVNARLGERHGDKWLGSRVLELVDKLVPTTLEALRKSCREYIATVNQQLLVSLLHLLEAFVLNHDSNDDEAPQPPVDDEAAAEQMEDESDPNPYAEPKIRPDDCDVADSGYYAKMFDIYFVVALVWSIGGNVNDLVGGREKFSAAVRPILTEVCPNLPQDGLVYDFAPHKRSAGFVSWEYKTPTFNYKRGAPFFDMIVPTAETTCFRTMQRLLSSVNRNVLLNGVTGVGKSVITMDFIFDELHADDPNAPWTFFTAVMSAQTSSANLQERIESKLHKKRNNLFGAPPGKRMIFFLDDLNMPKLETYGASPPIELVRQMIGHGGFYDRKKVYLFKHIEDVVILSACGPPGGGKNPVTQRLTSKFHMLCTPALPTVSMKKIFFSMLRGFLSIFPPEVRSMCSPVIEGTLECYQRIAAEMKPTPKKSHYTFNLRDLAKVIQGVLMIDSHALQDKNTLLRLWCHEASRVFHDRLIDDHDRVWWWKLLEELCTNIFKETWSPFYKESLFGDYMRREDKVYEEIVDIQKFHDLIVSDYEVDFNIAESSENTLVYFKDALHHLSRLCRVLGQPRGNALLVGVGGSGRQSLARLAAFMGNMKRFQIAITRTYGMNEFHEDLRKVLVEGGCENKPVAFILSDSQIFNEQIVEDINNVLNTGEVPNLLENEDYERILREVRVHAKKAGKMETRGVILAYFVQLVRDNVKIILAMSPIGDAFRTRLRMFPALVNCCTIDWYSKWPQDALLSVAEKAFGDVDVGSDKIRKAVCQMCVKIHQDVEDTSEEYWGALRRRNYTTPTSYLSLISSYLDMLAQRTEQVKTAKGRYQGGLDKLLNTAREVDTMKETLRKKQPELVAASKETEAIMVKIEREQKDADVIAAECKKEEQETSVVAKEAEGFASRCQEELDAAMPAYNKALAALDSLSKDDITLLKTMGSPPERVKLVLEAVLLLLGERDLSWASAKKRLADLTFMKTLKELNAEDLPEATIRKMNRTYINNPEFEPEKVKGASIAAFSLCSWARSVVTFNQVTKKIAPLKREAAEAEEKYKGAMAGLQKAKEKLAEVQGRVAALKRGMQQAVDKKKSLEDDIKVTEARLVRADKLISGLSSEQGRWEESVTRLEQERVALVGTTLLSAGSVAYTGPFTSQFRSQLIEAWTKAIKEKQIPVEEGFQFQEVAEPVRVRHWGIKGLPMDKFSIENATIVEKSHRWCLCIDPQGQANRWIRAMEADSGLTVVKLSDGKFMTKMENCIRAGIPVLLENIGEELDAALDPILQKQTVKKGGRLFIRLGDQDVEYEPSFRFYVTTKMPNPHYMPELQIKVTMINFTVTQKGLEDQLLADVIRCEKAELEEQLDQVIVQIADGKAQLKDIEDRILALLAAATGNILDNEELISTLGESKVTAEAIGKDVEKGEKAKAEIGQTRERYRVVATRGSLIYSVISEIGGMDHMYQYSLEFFKRLFGQTLRRTERVDDPDKRSQILIPAVTENTYNTICRGLFEKDKQLFAFLMIAHIFRENGSISPDEWNFVLNGSAGLRPKEAKGACPECLNEKQWNEMQILSELSGLEEVAENVLQNTAAWKAWVTHDEPQTQDIPGGLHDQLTPFQRLLVLRSLREDKVQYGITQVNGLYLGKMFTESPQFDLQASFGDSSNISPVVFVLTAGTDPTTTFYDFAAQNGRTGDRLLVRSLGQDQGKIAEEYINDASRTGDWVYLQNCHVYTSWMPRLEQLCEELLVKAAKQEVHPEFRLWLTSKPDPHFPVAVLQSGIKITKEPPKGLKANLRDAFVQSITPEMWDSSSNANAWRRLLFALTFFHGIIQERRKYGPLGWNILYEWNQSDLDASVVTLKTYLEDTDDKNIPWDAIRYLCGVINYGGRVTDFLDTRCLRTILQSFFTPDVITGEFKITDDGVYCIPADIGTIEACRSYLADLPPYEQPELFGLHGNANITCERNESQRMLRTLVEVQPRSSGGGAGRSVDEIIADMVADFTQRTPMPIDRSKAHEDTYRITETGDMVSLGTYVGQEIDVFNFLINVMRSSLKDLMAAVRGEVVLSAQLEQMFNDFLVNKVPANWGSMKLSYLSRKPLASWFVDTCQRVHFLREWNDQGPPVSYWVPGFYFPQGFLTAVLQTHSRRFKIPIDKLKFRTHVSKHYYSDQMESEMEEPETGVYTHGFFMEGARWNDEAECIVESRKGELYTQFPVIWMEPIDVKESVGDEATTYEIPMYKTTARQGTLSTTGLSTNLVTSLHIPSGKMPPAHWVKRSVAFLCMLDD